MHVDCHKSSHAKAPRTPLDDTFFLRWNIFLSGNSHYVLRPPSQRTRLNKRCKEKSSHWTIKTHIIKFPKIYFLLQAAKIKRGGYKIYENVCDHKITSLRPMIPKGNKHKIYWLLKWLLGIFCFYRYLVVPTWWEIICKSILRAGRTQINCHRKIIYQKYSHEAGKTLKPMSQLLLSNRGVTAS